MQVNSVLEVNCETDSPLGLDKKFHYISDKVANIENEELEFVIQRMVVRENMEEVLARKLRLEFLSFASLGWVTGKILSPSPLVDEFWHAFILFTDEYMEFCNKHFGHYLHHRPQDHSKIKTVRDSGPGMYTKQMIMNLYPEHDVDIWAETAICSSSHCDKIT